jgi:hypothetical protein
LASRRVWDFWCGNEFILTCRKCGAYRKVFLLWVG